MNKNEKSANLTAQFNLKETFCQVLFGTINLQFIAVNLIELFDKINRLINLKHKMI